MNYVFYELGIAMLYVM